MKNYNIIFECNYEGYNGYDHHAFFTYKTKAKTPKGAISKAKKKLLKDYAYVGIEIIDKPKVEVLK
jgi:hypothetical protein